MEKPLVLFDYHNWSISGMLDYLAVQNVELFHQPLTSVFASIRETFQHIYRIDQLWYSRMKGEEDSSIVSFNDPTQAKDAFNRLHEDMRLYFEKNTLESIVVYHNSTGAKFENKLEDLITHLVNHGTYHKGNVTAMLWSLGQKSSATDYIIYLREKQIAQL